MYDVVIIGGGIAGMTAAIFAARRELKTLIITADIGGQMAKNANIENWPGEDYISGLNLSQKTEKQVKRLGAEIKIDYIQKIIPKDVFFEVHGSGGSKYKTKTLILAYGRFPRKLGISNEEKLIGRGISYCATCDGPFFRQKDVAVVGGGNSAIDAALMMSKICKKVYLIHRRDQFRADEFMIEKVKKTQNIEIILKSEVVNVFGQDKLEGIELGDNKKIKLDGLFVEVGYVVDNSLVLGLAKINQNQEIVTDKDQMTSVPGIFAAGDLTDSPFQHLTIAAGEGTIAALSAYQYIQKKLK